MWYNKSKIKKTIKNHGVIAFPTETVMGLGVVYDDYEAYQNLNSLKGRDPDKPYTLMLYDKGDIDKYAKVNKMARIIIDNFMPGPITLLLPVKGDVPSFVTGNTKVIGIRVPDYQTSVDVLRIVGKPMLVTSANKSGEKPTLTYKDTRNIFQDSVYYIRKDSLGNEPSLVLDVSDGIMKVVRNTKDKALLNKIKAKVEE
ncbi:MAG: threonylcarbamoyl-AMP synthase [Coprobacillus sp.]|nr:threonylcarbamoyl-AMP synthase [Coprobacillus sp.]